MYNYTVTSQAKSTVAAFSIFVMFIFFTWQAGAHNPVTNRLFLTLCVTVFSTWKNPAALFFPSFYFFYVKNLESNHKKQGSY